MKCWTTLLETRVCENVFFVLVPFSPVLTASQTSQRLVIFWSRSGRELFY
jgi:hypothetical protein